MKSPAEEKSWPLSGIRILLALLFFHLAPGWPQSSPPQPQLQRFFQKQKVTIAVTDSGLGGLSVMAEASRRMKDAGLFKKVDFLFFNALFSSEGGYNSLKTRDEKVRIFSSALESLEKDFHPDLILIGCNTLSVICQDTVFSHRAKIPVVGIVEPGVGLIAQSLRDRPDSAVLIFGTPTTISEGTHQKMLVIQGFDPARIMAQSCPELESYIEKDYAGDETGMLISACVEESLKKIPVPRPPFFVSLNCTHFGYSLPLWQKAFEEAGVNPLAVLNPNSGMIDVLFQKEYAHRFPKTVVAVRVVSMVEIGQEKIRSLGQWLQNVSAETAEALAHYEYNPSLFEWKKYIR